MLGCAYRNVLSRTPIWVGCLVIGLSLATPPVQFADKRRRAEDRPAVYVPLKPPTRQQIDRRDSLKQYALGLLLERADRMLERAEGI